MKKHWKKILGWSIFVLVIFLTLIITLSVVGFNSAGITFYFDTVITKNFLQIPSLLLALITFIGYMVMKRGIANSLIGAIKTAIGYLLLAIGSSALTSLAIPVFRGLATIGGGGVDVTPLDPYFGLSSVDTFLNNALGATSFAAWVSYAFIIGFAINILLVVFKRWTNVHSLMITGHVMIQQSAIFVGALYFILFRKIPLVSEAPEIGAQIGTFVLAGLFLGVYWGVGTNGTIKATNKVTQNAGFAIGHQQMLSIFLVSKISRFFGKAENSAESRKMSKKFKIFEDNIFTQAVIILILFLILTITLRFGSETAPFTPGKSFELTGTGGIKNVINYGPWNIANGAYWLINVFLGSLYLVASVLAIVTGVRMFVTELQQSFQGISEKIIPGSVVAVDIAATYGFSPNSVTYGFVSGTATQFLAVGVVIGLSAAGVPITIAIPLFITLFFNSGALGIYANAYGGWKAAIIVPGIIGFAEIIITSFSLSLFSNPSVVGALNPGVVANETGITSPFAGGYIGMSDFTIFFALFMLTTGLNAIAGYAMIAVSIITLLILAQMTDTGFKSKPTFMQRMMRKLIKEKQKKQIA